MNKDKVGLAAEFAVASELCRRNVYAQLTLGHQKRTDLLIFSEDNNELLKIEVKGKQAKTWPNCRGIYGNNVMLVFVDFYRKGNLKRPDFYVLTVRDWREFANGKIKQLRARGRDVRLDECNVPIFDKQVNKHGQKYKGLGVLPNLIKRHEEKWEKIAQALARKSRRA